MSKRFFDSNFALNKNLSNQISANSSPRKLEDTKYYINELLHYKFKVANEAIFVLTVINIPPKIIITSTNS